MNDRFSMNGKAKPSQKAASEVRGNDLRSQISGRLDHLTGLWREIEEKLISRQPPRHVYYTYDDGDPSWPLGENESLCIGIAKHAGKWRLCLGEYNAYDGGNRVFWRPVTDCTMEERIELTRYVGKLEEEIVKTGEKVIPKLDEAIHRLQDRLAD
jgi:hypothetical protein